ncbi:MAG: hypothetical protein Q9170_006017 [Blastenia crenularia]
MQSPPGNAELPNVVRLCGAIKNIIEEHINSQHGTLDADIEPLRLEVQTLYSFLDLIEKVRAAKEPRLNVEESHLRDVSHLLRRCSRTLLHLHKSLSRLRDSDVEGRDGAGAWDLNTYTFTVPRTFISFYTRTLEVSLIGINLIHRWKSPRRQDGSNFNWDELSEATRQLQMTVIQRRNLTGGGDHEESVEEMGLLRDVELCLRSTEELMSVAFLNGHAAAQLSVVQNRHHTHLPAQWEADLPVRNGSRTSSSPPQSKTEDYGSDDSEIESIDYEPDHDVGFSAEVYSTMITTLMRELREKMEDRRYRDAENICKTVMRHSRDRETNLKIPFDNRAELDILLAEICFEQKRYQKVKKLIRPLLQDPTVDADCKAKLCLLLARAYFGRDQFPKAEACARSSLMRREKLHGKEHHLTVESAVLLIKIYEKQRDVTANVLREIYCPHTLRSPPSRSALLPVSKRRPPSNTQPYHDIKSPHDDQAPPDYQEENLTHNKKHLRWAPDVWTNESSINAPINERGQTQLIFAIHQADEVYVRLTIDRKANINKPCANGVSPLMHAVTLGHENIVELLLKEGAKVDTCTSGWTPLHKAIDTGNLPLTKLLLASGANIEAQSPLDFVQPINEHKRLKALANDEPDPRAAITPKSEHKWTPLLRAAFNGNEPAVRHLLDQNANIEAQSPSNATPLMYACENLHFSTVDLLAMRGANIHAADKYGWKPIHKCLVNLATRSPEAKAIVQLLLTHEANVNARCSFDRTPLHYAVEKSSVETVIFLLDEGADIEARDIAERTPLHTAIECRLEPMVRLLLEQTADASAMNRIGDDALAAANHAERRSPEIIDLLKENKKRMKRENSDALGTF